VIALNSCTERCAQEVVITTILSPLEVAKITEQVKGRQGIGIFGTYIQLYGSYGIAGFYKGYLISIVRSVVDDAVHSLSYRLMNKILESQEGERSPKIIFLAGVLGTLPSTVLTYPAQVVATRMITNSRTYQRTIETVKDIWVYEGPFAFFNGLLPGVLANMLYTGVMVEAFERFSRLWGNTGKDKFLLKYFLTLCAAAAVAQLLSFPLETVKLVMQSKTNPDGPVETFLNIVRQESVFALWKGISWGLLKTILSTSLFVISEQFFVERDE